MDRADARQDFAAPPEIVRGVGGTMRIHFPYMGTRHAGVPFRDYSSGVREIRRLNSESKIDGFLVILLGQLRHLTQHPEAPWWLKHRSA